MNLVPPQPPPPLRAGRAWLWPTLIVGLLVCQAALCAVTVYVATSDPSVVVEPQYYNRALHWDDQMRDERSSAALGWRHTLSIGPVGGPLRDRTVTVSLQDAHGAPLADASLELVAFHHARAADRLVRQPQAAGNGQYVATLPMSREGLWEFRLAARRGQEAATWTQVCDVAKGGTEAVAPK